MFILQQFKMEHMEQERVCEQALLVHLSVCSDSETKITTET